ncbi:MAG: efflux RND transporter permease subunit [Phycisphaerae bacterium]|nr:efflux RND transporter permease subunit [Phycisphaerae bacterium]
MATEGQHSVTIAIVNKFLRSNLAIILILLSLVVGAVALLVTPREEEPQIVVPLADVFVQFPGRSAAEVERLVSTPLETLLYQIDGVEHVYSMSRAGQATVTVRFHVGQDRERSLIKLYNKIEQNRDIVPEGVAGWVVKPVEIDDVPIVTLTLAGGEDDYGLRRVAEEMAERLAGLEDISRVAVLGGRPRQVLVYLDPEAMAGYDTSPAEIERAIHGVNVGMPAGGFNRHDSYSIVDAGQALLQPDELGEIVVSVHEGQPVFLKDVARIQDAPAEAATYVRFGCGPAWEHGESPAELSAGQTETIPAVTIAVAKKKGTNAVWVARAVTEEARRLGDVLLPDGVELVVTRDYGETANEKVNELVEALAVAVVIVILLLAFALGVRQAVVVAMAVPIVFGLTLTVNLLAGYTINRVTLFALILALGLLVDDPIVDVENIHRHFRLRRRATREIVLEAVNEIRPPLIAATLAVIVSFLPMLFITGMMGPYMRPMAMNVPVTMFMSMVVAFTITPWVAYHALKGEYRETTEALALSDDEAAADVKRTFLYRLFYPLMAPLLHSRRLAWAFLGVMAVLTAGSAMLAMTRHVPLKMLPFDNKNEFLLVLDFDEGTTLERTDAGVREFEAMLRTVPEVRDFQSYVGLASPMDFNGLVRHYYLRQGPNVAEIRVNLAHKRRREQQSHTIALRLRPALAEVADRCGASVNLVEIPPGPPVIATVVAEVFGGPGSAYDEIQFAAETVRLRLDREPGIEDLDATTEAPQTKYVFVPDKIKAALNGVTNEDVADAVATCLAGKPVGTLRVFRERQPLEIVLRVPEPQRSSLPDLARIHVKGRQGQRVALGEIGTWTERREDQTIYHKDLRPVVYVFAEAAGRAPADVILDIQADRVVTIEAMPPADQRSHTGAGCVAMTPGRPVEGRTFLRSGGGVPWWLPEPFEVRFSGEGEWQITLDVFRDLGLAFAAALIGIYILLVNQTGSFIVPLVVMLAIPLTIVGIMPGFWLLNVISGGTVAGYGDPVFFTATAMIGMIALAGIVTRDSIILVDFIHLSLRRGRTLFEAIMESRVVRLRPILLTTVTAMLAAVPITFDPIFSGLAWALIFGLLSSTVFTLFVIPVTYWLLYANKPGHGLPPE